MAPEDGRQPCRTVKVSSSGSKTQGYQTCRCNREADTPPRHENRFRLPTQCLGSVGVCLTPACTRSRCPRELTAFAINSGFSKLRLRRRRCARFSAAWWRPQGVLPAAPNGGSRHWSTVACASEGYYHGYAFLLSPQNNRPHVPDHVRMLGCSVLITGCRTAFPDVSCIRRGRRSTQRPVSSGVVL